MATQQISGAISGLDTASIIESLMDIESQKITTQEEKLADCEIKLECYQSINNLLAVYSSAVSTVSDSSLWDSYTAASSDSDSLTATVDEYATAGTYTFEVLQLAQSTQYMSAGFSDVNESAVSSSGATSIHIDSAKSSLNQETEVSLLNGGSGICRGSISITDKSGDSAVIDLAGAVTMQDVIEAINDSGLDVVASIADSSDGDGSVAGQALVITDTSGGSDTMQIKNVDGGTTATDLGIIGNDSASSGTIVGEDVYGLSASTSFDMLRDGLGVNDGTAGEILIRDENSGDEWTVDLSDVANLSGLISAVAEQTDGNVSVSIADDGMSLLVSGASGTDLTIESVGDGNTTAEDLGIAVTNGGESVNGSKLIAGMNSVQIASLSGANGTGINGAKGDFNQALGTFTADVNGTTVTFDLSSLQGDDSLDEMLATLNSQAEAQLGAGQLEFSINSLGNGIQVENSTGYDVEFTDASGSTASDLGISGSVVDDGDTLNGGDLDMNYISRATGLGELNNGDGVTLGTFLVTDASGFSVEVDISEATTVGEVVDLINECGLDVVAEINAGGDGILISESPDSGGTGEISVEEVDGGTTAADLGILGTGTGGEDGLSTLDGSFETVIEIDTNDTLTDVMNKISDQTSFVTSIINDGSEYNPYRLVIASSDTGYDSNFLIDTDLDLFQFDRTSEGQDSVILYGGEGSDSGSVMLRSSTNTNNSALLGVTLDLQSVSDGAVTITVAQDTDSIVEAFDTMVSAYNDLVELVGELDQYVDPDEDTDDDSIAGLLYADSSTRAMMRSLEDALFTTRDDCGDIMSLFDLGLGYDDEYALEFDSTVLEDLLESNYSDVMKFMVNTEDVATKTLGAVASASSTAASGTSLQNLVNGNDDVSEFGSDNGYEAATTIEDGGGVVTITLDEDSMVDYLVINHIDTDDMPAEDYALSDFLVEYLNADTGEWEELRTVSGNQSSSTVVGFTDPTNVSSIRITGTATNAEDDILRLTEIECISSNGVANKIQNVVDSYTDDEDGYFAVLEESLDTRMETIEDTIDDLNERLEAKEELLWEQYTAMELALAELQSESDYFNTQMDSLSGSE